MKLPNGFESVGEIDLQLPNGGTVMISKSMPEFSPWQGKPLDDDYNGKQVLDYGGTPMFAELVILRHFENTGWQGVWVDSFKNSFLTKWIESIELPNVQRKLWQNIQRQKGSRGGCFDIFCWKRDAVLFIESKRCGKDRIRPSQTRWLEAALTIGLPIKSFHVVEWTLKI